MRAEQQQCDQHADGERPLPEQADVHEGRTAGAADAVLEPGEEGEHRQRQDQADNQPCRPSGLLPLHKRKHEHKQPSGCEQGPDSVQLRIGFTLRFRDEGNHRQDQQPDRHAKEEDAPPVQCPRIPPKQQASNQLAGCGGDPLRRSV